MANNLSAAARVRCMSRSISSSGNWSGAGLVLLPPSSPPVALLPLPLPQPQPQRRPRKSSPSSSSCCVADRCYTIKREAQRGGGGAGRAPAPAPAPAPARVSGLSTNANARVTCAFGGGDKRDAARKALESALGEKKDAFSKWDEEIKKREAGGGGGGGGKGRGRGWGDSGSGGGGGGDSSSSDEGGSGNRGGEAMQVVYAFAGLASVYLILTKGSSMLALILNSILYVSRGFKPRPASRYAPAGPQQFEDAESHVKSKWGSDD